MIDGFSEPQSEENQKAIKTWVRAKEDREKGFVRRDGVVLKRTAHTYINAQVTYWAGSFNEPRGPRLRLLKILPSDQPKWDFENPEECIDLGKDEIATLRGFLNNEFQHDAGDLYWVPVPDKEIATSLRQLINGDSSNAELVSRLASALTIDSELMVAILMSDQAQLAIQLRERTRRSEVLEELERLINAPDTPESDFQRLLEQNPWVFGGEVVRVAELRSITSADEVDIPIVRGDGSVLIVELKRASAVSISRSDHGYPVLSVEVHLAIQQAQRYLYELDRIADTLLQKHRFDARRATALVVIGKDPQFDDSLKGDKFRESLRIYNSHLARVQLITYDALLSNARRLLDLNDPQNETEG